MYNIYLFILVLCVIVSLGCVFFAIYDTVRFWEYSNAVDWLLVLHCCVCSAISFLNLFIAIQKYGWFI